VPDSAVTLATRKAILADIERSRPAADSR
jgi:hypothetical protein